MRFFYTLISLVCCSIFNQNEKYIAFALRNYTYNVSRLDDNTTFGPVRVELLLTTYKSYHDIKEINPESESIKKFDLDQLEESIEINLEVLFRLY